MLFNNLSTLLAGSFLTFVMGVLIILTQRWHGRWTHDHAQGIQKFHQQPTPRIGGVGIVMGMIFSIMIWGGDLTQELFKPLIIAGMIPFFFGFREDLTKAVSVRDRLLATMAGAFLVVILTQMSLNRVDIPGVDDALQFWPLAAMLTIVAVAGVTNAINILDGFNGLASGTCIVILACFGWMAHLTHDQALLEVSLVLASCLLGFMALNYPFGKIFLGDSGAYFVGFMIAWMAILLPMHHPDISPWATLLVCAYPVVEVLYSMWRRMRTRFQAGQPDNLHLHTLIKTRLLKRYFSFVPSWFRNSMVAPGVWLCSGVLGFMAIRYVSSPPILAILFAIFVLWYHVTYGFLSSLPE